MLEAATIQPPADYPMASAAPTPSHGGAKKRNRRVNALHRLRGVSGKSSQGKYYASVVLALVAELGGEAALGEESRVQVRQVGALTIRLEEMQGALVRGEAVDLEAFTRMSNSLTRTLRALGIKRRAATPPMTFRERLAQHGKPAP
jgi:hypothetical protein